MCIDGERDTYKFYPYLNTRSYNKNTRPVKAGRVFFSGDQKIIW
jgi:hypothetical protein